MALSSKVDMEHFERDNSGFRSIWEFGGLGVSYSLEKKFIIYKTTHI